MRTITKILLILFFILNVCNIQSQQTIQLWYQQPATEWMQATPLGNGRLGAMVYGSVEKEIIGLDEITMWSGQVDKFQERPCGKEALNDIRELFFQGNYAKGNQIATELLSGTPHSFGSHVPLGNLNINFQYPKGKLSGYRRQLNLETAISQVEYKIGNVQFKREVFCSNPDDVIVLKIAANKKGMINCAISLDLLREASVISQANEVQYSGTVSFPKQGPGGVGFLGKTAVSTVGGTVNSVDGVINIRQATEAIIIIDVRTNYKNNNYKEECNKTVLSALNQRYDVLKKKHIQDYSNLFKRVELSLGESKTNNQPTDVRWQNVKNGSNDIGLDALFFHYGRYLLIAASRENSPLPANLQGVWNDNLACNMGWTNDYHLDINTQQNYWLSNIANLAECNAPLFSYIEDLSVAGAKTAQKVYGTRGWTAHTVANVWGYTAPGASVNWGLFPTASSWIASHLWTHYRYTKDDLFLKEKAYPLLKSNAEFLLDYMVINPNNGYLMTGPSTSPENSFIYKGQELSLSMMPACDRQLVFETFTSVIEASKILNVDASFRDSLEKALLKLPPIMIGKNGAIQEWFEDFEEAHPNHRHTTHLLALYPFSQITLDKTPELAKAAEKTIQYRLAAEGWEDVEWSRANAICNYARLKQPEKAYESVVELQRLFTRENLLTISPKGIAGAPYDIFIYDGNEAGAAGIVEMLLQCHEGYIDFLPALPDEWKTGYFKGLCVTGGGVVYLKWVDGKVQNARISTTVNSNFKLKLDTKRGIAEIRKNGKSLAAATNENGIFEFQLNVGEELTLKYSDV